MRAISEGLGVRTGMLCEWTATTQGRVDFYIPEMCWAVELLREGSKASISQRAARFTSAGGQYRQWVHDGLVKEWIVVDCRTSIPENISACPFFLQGSQEETYRLEQVAIYMSGTPFFRTTSKIYSL